MKPIRKQPQLEKSQTVKKLRAACSNELLAVEFLEKQRWGNCPGCVHCCSTNLYKMTGADGQRSKRFLMPSKEIEGQLKGMSLQRAAMLKPHWRASMAALVRRARDLGAITQRHYHTLCAKLGAAGYRTNEPIELPEEEPKAFRRLIEVYKSAYGYSDADIDRLLFTNDPRFFSWHGLKPPQPMRLTRPLRAQSEQPTLRIGSREMRMDG